MTRIVVFCLLLALTVCSAGQRGLPAQQGIPNFGKVNEKLYRGAQPSAEAINALKLLGIKSIISLRSTDKAWKAEAAAAQANGLVCTNIPLSGVSRPKTAEIQKVLSVITNLPSPVFVHCQHGCDRTGTIIACYRIQFEKWTSDAALREAEHYGMSKLEHGMKDFVVDFAKTMR